VTTPTRAEAEEAAPFVVELEAELLGGNLVEEAFWSQMKHNWRTAFALRRGALIDPEHLDFTHMPWDEATLDALAQARKAGRRIVLVAQSAELGEAAATALGGADEIRTAPPTPTRPRPTRRRGPLALETLHAMRPHQWVKNLVVFLPMILSHDLSLATFGWSLLAFVSFTLLASAVYLVNDLTDLASDRRHPSKHRRPFAAGRLPLTLGTRALPALLIGGFGLAALGGWGLLGVMVLYAITTTAYSLRIKGMLAADITVIAMLYALRVIAGSAATGITPSMWFLSFTIFIFFSLGAVKRLTELTHLAAESSRTKTAGRAYTTEDRPVVAMLATSAGFIAVLVLTLYVDSGEVRGQYGAPELLWGISLLLLFWISRTVLLAHRGQVDQDPVVFALTDPMSLWAGLATAGLFLLAIFG